MTREEYLQEVWGRLSNKMPRPELESLMKYYEEYFGEAGPDREAEVIAELGTPAELCGRILGDRAAVETPYYQPRPRRRWSAGQIVAVVCLFPIWLPLLIAAFTLVVGVMTAAFVLVVGVAAGGVGCIGAGAFSIWCGFTQIFHSIPTAVFFAGLGLLAAAIGLAFFLAGVALGGVCCKGTAAFFRWVFRRDRKEALV